MVDWLRRHTFSLTTKILLIFVPLATLSVVGLLGAITAYHYHTGVQQLRHRIDETARVNAPLLAEALWQFKTAEIVAAVRSLSSSSSVLAITVYDAQGTIVALAQGSNTSEMARDIVARELIFPPPTARAVTNEIGALVIESSTGLVVEEVRKDLAIGFLLLAAMVIALVAATLITTRMVIVRPLRLLERSIEAGRTTHHATKVDWQSDDELGHVVAAYNDMIQYKADAARLLQRANEELEDRVRERTHELEEARDRAQAATEAKANFLAAMSHEIRTPMNGVVGMIDLLADSPLDDDQRKMVGTIKTSAYALLGIIGDILDFSKLEAGRLKIESMPLSIVDIFESVGVTLWSSALKKGLMMPMFCDPRIPSQVYGDPVRLRQILTNLIGNAIKFTDTTPERQGKVVVRADLVDEAMDRVKVRFSVADNGIGIDGDTMARLFRPFEQADVSTVRRYGGTGLGLSICKHLTTLMDGKIAVESEPGAGSTFTVELSFEAVAGEQPDADLTGLRVLMLVRQQSVEAGGFLIRYINHCGGTAEIVHDRDACVNRLRAAAGTDAKFDVLVVGMRLPRSEKLAFRDSLMALPGLGSLRFVLLDYEYQRAPSVLDRNTVTITGAPICRSIFVTGIAIACGRASPATQSVAERRAAPKVKAPSVEEARAAGRLILVAEDNETNQDVVRLQLAALGYASVVVENGRQALDAYRTGEYTLLLTDCHMPVMDGYRLTEIIRAEEKGTGRRLPIIAITANALHGEAERCLAIGMDDFIVKPIELHAFRRVLRRWIPGDPSAPEETNSPTPALDPATRKVFDPAALRRIVGDDAGIIASVLADFEGPARRAAGDIEIAFGQRDASAIGFAAHKLKSSSRAIGAEALAEMCEALEQAGTAGDWASIDALAPRLGKALDAVVGRIALEMKELSPVDA